MARFKVVLTVINEESCTPFVIGPRFRRGTVMPMEDLFDKRGGYWFDPETELELARECADRFEKYLNQAEQRKGKKK